MNNNTLFGVQPVTSISYSNDEIIKNIMLLNKIDRFCLDCTYSTGVFWKNLPQPVNKTDLLPKSEDVIKSDSSYLPFKDLSMQSIMFDPPFIITGGNHHEQQIGSSIIGKRFEGYKNFEDLKKHYIGTIREGFRLLKDSGIMVIKCQDIVSSGKNHFTHCMVMDMAMDVGFYPKDLFILMAKNRINSFNGEVWKNQYHARKHHSYFWVLSKESKKVNYSF